MNLFEAYKKRLAVAEKVYAAKHHGETMDTNRKLVVATCLKNINGLLNEAFGAGSATQSGAAVSVLNQQNPQTLGNYKKFSMNLTNVALN